MSFGEIVWDEVELGAETNVALGGSACAMALHASALGARVHLVSAVGTDDFGRLAVSELERRGPRSEWILVRSDAKTARVHVTLADDGPRYTPICRFDWASVDFTSALRDALRGADALMFNLFLQGTEVPFDQLRRAFATSARPRHVGCDLNVRHATKLAALEQVRALVDFVKLNEVELERVRSVIGDSDVAGFFLQQSNVRFVVETHGAQGARLVLRDGCVDLPAPAPSAPRHSVGAGDAFMARLTVALCCGHQPREAFEEALRYASEHVAARARLMESRGENAPVPPVSS